MKGKEWEIVAQFDGDKLMGVSINTAPSIRISLGGLLNSIRAITDYISNQPYANQQVVPDTSSVEVVKE